MPKTVTLEEPRPKITLPVTKKVELGQKGRVVIPKEIRDLLEVSEGDELLFMILDGEVKLTTRKALIRKLRGKYAIPGRSIVDEFLADRRAEAEAKGGEWMAQRRWGTFSENPGGRREKAICKSGELGIPRLT